MEKMRLQKFLASSGVASRRKAEEMILGGVVAVNGEVVTEMGTMVEEGDQVTVKGKPVSIQTKTIYAFYKPKGVTSTMQDVHAEQTIADFFKGIRVFPVGRLDKYSEGLLIVTNDGELANELTHPRYEHEKEYEVEMGAVKQEWEVSEERLKELEKSYMLDGKRTVPMKVVHHEPIVRGWRIRVTLKEGKNRQIRRIAEKLGYRIRKLKRVRIGRLLLGELEPGRWRTVTREDII